MVNAPPPSSPASGKPSGEQNLGCIVIAVIVGGIFLVAKCSAPTSTGSAPQGLASSAAASEAAPAAPPPITELAVSDMKLGAAGFSKVVAVDDATSAMIYSKNCYGALEEAFSWSKLDRCGTFDALAARNILSEAIAAEETEIAYFDSETSAGRYLGAGTSHGADSSIMDVRWDAVTGYGRALAKKEEAARSARQAAAEASAAASDAAASEANIEAEDNGVSADD